MEGFTLTQGWMPITLLLIGTYMAALMIALVRLKLFKDIELWTSLSRYAKIYLCECTPTIKSYYTTSFGCLFLVAVGVVLLNADSVFLVLWIIIKLIEHVFVNYIYLDEDSVMLNYTDSLSLPTLIAGTITIIL